VVAFDITGERIIFIFQLLDTACILSLGEINWSQELVALSCNPSYSGGREQEDRGSKPAHADSL
jgi:hypothetical protein